MLAEAAVDAVRLHVGRLDVAAEIAAIDFGFLAGTADDAALQLDCHSLPHLVAEHERSLVRHTKIAAHGEHALALDLIAEDRNLREVAFQGQLVAVKQGARRDREIGLAGAAAKTRGSIRPASVIGIQAAAARAHRLAFGGEPTDLAERGFRLFVRHAEHLSEAQGLGCRGKEEVL